MAKQPKSSTAPAATVMDIIPCTLCKESLVTEIQAIIQTKQGVLTSDNKTILEALPLLDTKGLVSVVFNLMIEKQDASIDSRFSPQKPPPIISTTKDFKKLVSPVDEKFFDSFKDDGVPTIEWWQHFVGSLMHNEVDQRPTFVLCTQVTDELPIPSQQAGNLDALFARFRQFLPRTSNRSTAQEEGYMAT